MWDSASATPSLHPTKLINKLNNYVKELYSPLPNGTNIGGDPVSVNSHCDHAKRGKQSFSIHPYPFQDGIRLLSTVIATTRSVGSNPSQSTPTPPKTGSDSCQPSLRPRVAWEAILLNPPLPLPGDSTSVSGHPSSVIRLLTRESTFLPDSV